MRVAQEELTINAWSHHRLIEKCVYAENNADEKFFGLCTIHGAIFKLHLSVSEEAQLLAIAFVSSAINELTRMSMCRLSNKDNYWREMCCQFHSLKSNLKNIDLPSLHQVIALHFFAFFFFKPFFGSLT